MEIVVGLFIGALLFYFIFMDKPTDANYSTVALNSTNTNNRYNNVYDVWVCDNITDACQKVLIDMYNYTGSITIYSVRELLDGGEELHKSYVKLNSNWTEENDDYIESIKKRAVVMGELLDLGIGGMVVWCDKSKRWDCDRRVFKYKSNGSEK